MPDPTVAVACENPAVARCVQAYQAAYDAAIASRQDRIVARTPAGEAYRKAMPPLVGYENIRDFVACLAYGMLNNILRADEGTKLLYAAQVAQASVRKFHKNNKLDKK